VIVVIDTNVWISALQFAKHRGTPTLALEKAMSEDVIATCDEIDAKIIRVLTEKFSWEQHRAVSALQAILARGIRVKIRGKRGTGCLFPQIMLSPAQVATCGIAIFGLSNHANAARTGAWRSRDSLVGCTAAATFHLPL